MIKIINYNKIEEFAKTHTRINYAIFNKEPGIGGVSRPEENAAENLTNEIVVLCKEHSKELAKHFLAYINGTNNMPASMIQNYLSEIISDNDEQSA